MGYPGFEPENDHVDPEVDITKPKADNAKDDNVGVVNSIETKIGIPWKSILAFLGVFGGQLWARAAVNGVAVLPESLNGWLALIGGSFIAAVGVYLKNNIYTVPQAQAKLEDAINNASTR